MTSKYSGNDFEKEGFLVGYNFCIYIYRSSVSSHLCSRVLHPLCTVYSGLLDNVINDVSLTQC